MFRIIDNSYKLNEKNELTNLTLELVFNKKFTFDLAFQKKQMTCEDVNLMDEKELAKASELEYYDSSFEFRHNKFYVIALNIISVNPYIDFTNSINLSTEIHNIIYLIVSKSLNISKEQLINTFNLNINGRESINSNKIDRIDISLIYIFDISNIQENVNTENQSNVDVDVDDNSPYKFCFNAFRVTNESFIVSLENSSKEILDIEVTYKMIRAGKSHFSISELASLRDKTASTQIPSLYGKLKFQEYGKTFFLFIILEKDFLEIYNGIESGEITILKSNKFDEDLDLKFNIYKLEYISDKSLLIFLEERHFSEDWFYDRKPILLHKSQEADLILKNNIKDYSEYCSYKYYLCKSEQERAANEEADEIERTEVEEDDWNQMDSDDQLCIDPDRFIDEACAAVDEMKEQKRLKNLIGQEPEATEQLENELEMSVIDIKPISDYSFEMKLLIPQKYYLKRIYNITKLTFKKFVVINKERFDSIYLSSLLNFGLIAIDADSTIASDDLDSLFDIHTIEIIRSKQLVLFKFYLNNDFPFKRNPNDVEA